MVKTPDTNGYGYGCDIDLQHLTEPDLAALHLAVVTERTRRLHEPDQLQPPDDPAPAWATRETPAPGDCEAGEAPP